MTVSSMMPPVSRFRSVERVELYVGRDAIDEGVMSCRKASAPGPENSCWTLSKLVNIEISIKTMYLNFYAHMPHVKQARLFSSPVVRVDDAQVAVLHGHRVATEGHELGAISTVKIIEVCFSYTLSCRV